VEKMRGAVAEPDETDYLGIGAERLRCRSHDP
jgi:hypothetical protein